MALAYKSPICWAGEPGAGSFKEEQESRMPFIWLSTLSLNVRADPHPALSAGILAFFSQVPLAYSKKFCAGLTVVSSAERSRKSLLVMVFWLLLWQLYNPVSYTHLRAHETDSYLVCRLLLE